MERSRSNKRNYYYDNSNTNNNGGQDFYDSENLGRTKPRYNPHHHQNRRGGGGGGGMGRKIQEIGVGGGASSAMVTTSYRILCHDLKAGGVIGKSGSIIKAIRQHTGAWINVHELVPGDEERIIEITDTRRRDPDGRMPSFSPAQEALFLVHERILESEFSGGSGGGYNSNGVLGDEGDEYGGGFRGNRVATRLVVSRMHVGSLLGKGGKIIEQMRVETKTHIRILPRDHTLPRCVSMSEEIVQIVGDIPAVKNALANVSSRLRESQHRDRSNFQHRQNFYPGEDDFIPHMNYGPHRSSIDSPRFGSQLSPSMSNTRQNMYSSHQPGYRMDSGTGPMTDNGQQAMAEDLVFRILCPTDKVDCVVGESEGIIELLREEIGVDVKVTNPVADSGEQIIIISSNEGPDDELFPAQEALLHVQTHIVDLLPDKDNIVTTRLLVQSGEIGCLEGKDGSLSEMKRLTGADIEILPRDKVPEFVSGNDELLQIVGEIKAARNAVVEITTKLRDHMYREIFQKDEHSGQPVPGTLGSGSGIEAPSPRNISQTRESQIGNNRPTSAYQNLPPAVVSPPSKESAGSGSEITRQSESATREDTLSVSNRKPLQLVTRSILEVVVPEYAIPKLVARSKNKIVQISELSGARLTLVDDVAEGMEKVIQISGTREQVERAQSLLQGFILSTQEEDGP